MFCLLRFWSYEAKCLQRGCFRRGVDLFALKFYLDGVIPINQSRYQKTRDNGLPGGEDCIPLCSLVLTQYQSVTDGQTDAQTDGRTDLPQLIQRLKDMLMCRKDKRQCIFTNEELETIIRYVCTE